MLTRKPLLKSIIFHNNNVQVKTFTSLLKAINHKTNFCTIELNNVRFYMDLNKNIEQSFSDKYYIELSEDIVTAILDNFNNMKNLYLVNLGLSVKASYFLAEKLIMDNRALQTLDLSFCNLSDKEMIICSWLTEKNLVKHLSLRCIGIKKCSLTRFSAGLSKTNNLATLDLSENEINDLDLSVLFQSLLVSDTVSKLILNKLKYAYRNQVWLTFNK